MNSKTFDLQVQILFWAAVAIYLFGAIAVFRTHHPGIAMLISTALCLIIFARLLFLRRKRTAADLARQAEEREEIEAEMALRKEFPQVEIVEE